MKDKSPLFQRAVILIRAIPKGKVLTYGKVSSLISAPGCARHISYILSSSSEKYRLPWHRVIGANGKVSMHANYLEQLEELEREGVALENFRVDLDKYGWQPSKKALQKLLKGIPEHRLK